jgi:E2F-associated phosphoprotein
MINHHAMNGGGGGDDAHNSAPRPIVTSASEHEDEGADDDSSSSSSNRGGNNKSDSDDDRWSAADDGREVYFPEDLLDEGADEEDEAYVYRNLRSGTLESVTIVHHHQQQQQQLEDAHMDNSGDGNSKSRKRKTTHQVLKPRSSDAVLSCPCCFTIVTMDCQRHERLLNQFRAMFVMNIEVNWFETWVHSEFQHGLLVRRPLDEVIRDNDGEAGRYYYTVNCSTCSTQVAVLDMSDEVYHFTGCLASS